jgi:FKBP-type peptidyl-prolyl cis-trans isomerase FklB
MKRIPLIISAVAFCFPLLSFTIGAEEKSNPELKRFADKISYVLGLEVGRGFKESPTKIDLDIFMRGVEDGIQGRQPALSPQELNSVKKEFSAQVKEQRAKKAASLAEENHKAEEEFLEKNKTKKGVVTTASGLQYIVLKEGNGPKPQKTDKVKVNYRGNLLDGTEFDSSYKRGKAAILSVAGVIPGWTEALQLMNVDSKYRLFIPSKLAYGTGGAGNIIGPNAMLIFEVELLEIVD